MTEKAGWNKGKGKAVQWLKGHVNYEHEEWCLIWPFASLCRGYGQLGYLGRNYYAHRLMCEFVHGPAPTEKHEAGHSCGRGHEGCVNPRHLSWRTRTEQMHDSAALGNQARSTFGNQGRVTAAEAHQIRLMKGVKLQREIAELFNVSESTVSDIWLGRTHARPSKIKHFSPEEDARILELHKLNYTFSGMARVMGRNGCSIGRRAKAMGLTANYDPTIDNRPLAKQGSATTRL